MYNLKNPALIVIDMQKGFNDESYFGKRNNPNLEGNIAKLITYWRNQNAKIIHIFHDSQEIASPLRSAKDGFKALPGLWNINEQSFVKTVNSAFIGTRLEASLREQAITNLVLVGLTTDHCVSTTARMGANLGFNVYVVSDACATFPRAPFTAELVHDVALASLEGEFATIVQTGDLCP